MVRPRGFDPEQVAEQLLDAFWTHGYSGTSVAHLTEATGLLPGSLYAAFGSKERMFRAALERYLAQLRAAILTDAPGVQGIEHVLNAVVRLTLRDRKRRGCLLINAIPESGVLTDETARELRNGLQAMRVFMRARLAEVELRSDVDAESLASLLLAASVSIRVLGRARLSRSVLQQVADGAVASVRQSAEPS